MALAKRDVRQVDDSTTRLSTASREFFNWVSQMWRSFMVVTTAVFGLHSVEAQLVPLVASSRVLVRGLDQPGWLVVDSDIGSVYGTNAAGTRIWHVIGDQIEGVGTLPEMGLEVAGVCLREHNLLSVVGRKDGQIYVRMGQLSPGKKPPNTPMLETQTSVINWPHPCADITAVTASDFAIYLSIVGPDLQTRLIRLPADRMTLGAPHELVRENASNVQSLAISPDGHLLAAVRVPDGRTELQFLHAETGRRLLRIKTTFSRIDGLSYSATGQLYALAERDGQIALFQIAVEYSGAAQIIRLMELATAREVRVIAAVSDGVLALQGGEEGQLWGVPTK